MVFGVIAALGATVCFAVGNILEKRGVDRLGKFSLRRLGASAGALLRSSWWLAGAVVSVLGLLAQMFAFSRLAISVVQSLGAVGVLVLVLASRLYLKERFGSRELLGIGMAVTSLVFVSLSLTPHADESGHRGPVDLAWVCGAATLVAVGLVLSQARLRGDRQGFVLGTCAGLLYGLSGLGAKGISVLVTDDGLPGAFGHLLESPYLYLFVGGWVLAFGIFQFGIQRSRVGVVGPISSMLGSVYIVAVGTPVFGESLPRPALLLTFRLAGFVGLLAGSALLARGEMASAIEAPPMAEVSER